MLLVPTRYIATNTYSLSIARTFTRIKLPVAIDRIKTMLQMKQIQESD